MTFGEEGIRELGLGLKAAGIRFQGRIFNGAVERFKIHGYHLRETGLEAIPYKRDKRIREWCF